MADKLPQADLPRGVSGGADEWDEGPAGVILSGEFFQAAAASPDANATGACASVTVAPAAGVASNGAPQWALITSGSTATNAAVQATASVTLTAGRLYLLAVTTDGVNTTDREVPTGVTHAAGTFALVDSQNVDAFVTQSLWLLQPSSTASGVVTITNTLTQDIKIWSLLEWTDYDSATQLGTVSKTVTTNATSVSVSLAAAGSSSPSRLALHTWVQETTGTAATATPASGWTEVSDNAQNESGFSVSMQVQARDSDASTAAATWSNTGNALGVMSVEVRSAAAAGTNATATGAPAAVTLTAATGTATGSSVINGTATGAAASASTAPATATASGAASRSASPAAVSVTSATGSATGTVTINATANGAASPVSVAAPAGSAAGTAAASAASAPVSLSAATGTASGGSVVNATGTGAPAAAGIAAGTGSAVGTGSASVAAVAVSLAPAIGTASGSTVVNASAAGAAASVSAAPAAASATGAASATAAAAPASIVAATGSASAASGVNATGAPASINTSPAAATASGTASVSRAAVSVSVSAATGVATGGSSASATGALSTVTVVAATGTGGGSIVVNGTASAVLAALSVNRAAGAATSSAVANCGTALVMVTPADGEAFSGGNSYPPLVDDVSPFFGGPFVSAGTWGALSAQVILDEPTEDVLAGRAQSHEYQARLQASDWPGIARGASVVIAGGTYTVREVELVGDGRTKRLRLTLASGAAPAAWPDDATASVFFDAAAFGRVATFGALQAVVLLDAPDEDILNGRAQSRGYVARVRAGDLPGLVRGSVLTIDGTTYQVREVERVADGATLDVHLTRTGGSAPSAFAFEADMAVFFDQPGFSESASWSGQQARVLLDKSDGDVLTGRASGTEYVATLPASDFAGINRGATVLVPPYSYTVREVTHTGDGALKRLRMTRQ